MSSWSAVLVGVCMVVASVLWYLYTPAYARWSMSGMSTPRRLRPVVDSGFGISPWLGTVFLGVVGVALILDGAA